MIRVVADENIPFLSGILEPYAEVVYAPGHLINKQLVKNADALLIRTRTICNKELLQGSKVKFIGTATIGFDHIDTKWCESKGIIWRNAPGCNSGSVNQYVAAALVHLSKKYNFKFEDKTLGVVGIGNVGSKIVRLAEALGMRVVLNDPPRARASGTCGFISLDGLLREADIISIHTPLITEGSDKTFHLFNDNVLSKTLKGTILINTSRGEVVDTASLLYHLNNSHLAACALDVWENEPNIDSTLLAKAELATPHIAGYAADGKANGTEMVVKSLNNYFRLGLPRCRHENIPVLHDMVVEINCEGKTQHEILSTAIDKTYNIDNESVKLKQNKVDFELHRAQYPLRREFNAYRIRLTNATKAAVDSLQMLGFNVNSSK